MKSDGKEQHLTKQSGGPTAKNMSVENVEEA